MKKIQDINENCIKNLEYLRSHFTADYIESMTDSKEYVVG